MIEPVKYPLIVPRTQVRHVRHHSLCNSRWARLEELAEAANVRRPGVGPTPAKPSIGALLEALATGQIGIVRMDDPERRVLGVETRRAVGTAGTGGVPRDPRCPGDWDE